jgi:hypothetical protein
VRVMARALAAALVVVAVGATDMAAAEQADSGDRRALQREREIVALMNRAIGVVQRDPSCRPQLPQLGPRPDFTDDAPSAELLGTLAILRRPQTPEELAAADSMLPVFANDIYRRYIRIARSAGGRTYLIVPARRASFYKPRPRRCLAEVRERFARLIEGRSRTFRRLALRELERIIRSEWAAPAPPSTEGVFMQDFRPEGGPGSGSGGESAAVLRRRGMYSTFGSGTLLPAVVSALIPDGVASVTVTYPRKASRGPHRRPRIYSKRIRLTVPVQDNVISFVVPRFPVDAFPARQVWRSGDGRVIRVVE